jgi:hypothetical protein
LENIEDRLRSDADELQGYLGGRSRKTERIFRQSLEIIEKRFRSDAAEALRVLDEEKEHRLIYAESIEE